MYYIFRKDVEGFFAWPVNDIIAPGYSSIILQPMDFCTMKKKIEREDYNSIDEYKVFKGIQIRKTSCTMHTF